MESYYSKGTDNMLSKKHYEALAKMVNNELISGYDTVYKSEVVGPEPFVHALADYLERDNPNFNRARFMGACGLYFNK